MEDAHVMEDADGLLKYGALVLILIVSAMVIVGAIQWCSPSAAPAPTPWINAVVMRRESPTNAKYDDAAVLFVDNQQRRYVALINTNLGSWTPHTAGARFYELLAVGDHVQIHATGSSVTAIYTQNQEFDP